MYIHCCTLIVLLGATVYGQCPSFQGSFTTGVVLNGAINEASGLAASRSNPGVLWVHNDSGGQARVFAMDYQGHDLGYWTLVGAVNRDWEDMAIGPGPTAGVDYLYLGDIGDNNAVHASVKIYRVAEPVVSTMQTPSAHTLSGVGVIELTYPDGPRDAETLLVDPVSGDIYIVSKELLSSRVYRAAYPQSTSSSTVMTYLGTVGVWFATAGDAAPDASGVLIRGYNSARYWPRSAGQNLWQALQNTSCTIPLASEQQGETITFDYAATGYLTVSEGTSQPLHYYVLPNDCDNNQTYDAIDIAMGTSPDVNANGVPDACESFCGDAAHPYPSGDLNRDCYVEWADFGIFADNWQAGSCASPDWCSGADLDRDGVVVWSDFGIFATGWQSCTHPEPPCSYNP